MNYSKIRDVCIELSSYTFKHSPSTLDRPNPNFVGRTKFFERFKLAISPEGNTRGAYLVTGYRGMGKTSAVMKALRDLRKEYKAKNIDLQVIELSLSQNDVDEIDLLRQLTKLLLEGWVSIASPKEKRWKDKRSVMASYLAGLFAFLLPLYLFITNPIIWEIVTSYGLWHVWLIVLLFLLVFSLYVRVHTGRDKYIRKNKYEKDKIHLPIKNRLLSLNNRLYAATTKSRETSESMGGNAGFKFFDAILDNVSHVFSFQRSKKNSDVINYSAASYKEIEKELLLILESIKGARGNQYFNVPHFIFVIDELDKVAPDYPSSKQLGLTQENNASLRRSRTEAITSLLSRMKNFITSAEGKFIFIGGRDMYDASLADIADREAFFSSIFNHVFNLNSFFKDSIEGKKGVTEVSEGFLCQYLNEGSTPEDRYKLSTFIKSIKARKAPREFTDREIIKLTVLLQCFIIFLTYRSNGSPKKIIELFEKYIISQDRFKKIKSTYEPLIVTSTPPGTNNKNKVYLRFSYIQQYEIGATASLYRPYLIVHSRHLKLLEDKLLYSSAFIIDHILKFHKNAFSWNNVEVIPDIILDSSNPNLRPYLQEIMDFFSNIHIRQTVNAIYQYKFYSKSRNEIQYLSKVSELSSAAFNFTLDESRHIKNYYQNLLNQKRAVYNNSNIDADHEYVHSIEYLNTVLGDLEYYDQNYHKAILKYTDAIQTLRNVLTNGNKMSHHQSTLFVRKKLKLGLALEKLRAFDSSYSIYRSLTLQVGNLASFKSKKDKSSSNNDNWELPFRRMQLFVRPHISLLDLIEKQRVDGITFSNLKRNISDYCTLLSLKDIFPSTEYEKLEYDNISKKDQQSDNKRLQTLIYDYYNNVGSILFFKNKNFVRLHKLAFTSLLKNEIPAPQLSDKLKAQLVIPEKGNKPATGLKVNKNILSNLYNFTKYQCYNRVNNKINKILLKRYSPSLSSYFYYRAGLKNFILPYEENLIQIYSDLTNDDNKIILNDFLLALRLSYEDSSIILNSTQNFILGNILTKIGDSALAIVSKYSAGELDTKALDLFTQPLNSSTTSIVEEYFRTKFDTTNSSKQEHSYSFDVNLPIYIYFLSSIFYLKSSRSYSYAFQKKKVLYIIRDFISQSTTPLNGSDEAEIEKIDALITKAEKIASTIISNTNNISGASDTAEYLKYINFFKYPNLYKSHLLTSLSTSQEVKETLILAEQIRIRLYKRLPIKRRKYIKKILDKDDVISNIYVRIIEMNYQSEFNYYLLSTYLSHKFTIGKGLSPIRLLSKIIIYLTQPKSPEEKQEEAKPQIRFDRLKELILDSIFCLQEAIKAIEIYGRGYIITNSYLGNLHLKLSTWCFIYSTFCRINSNTEEELSLLFGEGNIIKVNQKYHLEIAGMMFNDSIELHNQGKPYKAIKSNMYFLEDDYNDNLTHFCASIERYNLNTGTIGNKLEKIEDELKLQNSTEYKDFFHDRIIERSDFFFPLSKKDTDIAILEVVKHFQYQGRTLSLELDLQDQLTDLKSRTSTIGYSDAQMKEIFDCLIVIIETVTMAKRTFPPPVNQNSKPVLSFPYYE